MSIQTVMCLAVVDKLLFFITPNYKTSSVYISQAWPDYSRLRNSQETLEYCICTSATIVAEPIRLQSGYEECGDDVCGRNLAYLER